MHIDQKVVVTIGGEHYQGVITRLPGEVPRGCTTGSGEWPYFGVLVASASSEPVLLYFLAKEMTLNEKIA